jgi:hypothetical protein
MDQLQILSTHLPALQVQCAHAEPPVGHCSQICGRMPWQSEAVTHSGAGFGQIVSTHL